MTKDENCNVVDGFVNCGNGNCLQCNGQGRGIEHHKLTWFVDLINIYYEATKHSCKNCIFKVGQN